MVAIPLILLCGLAGLAALPKSHGKEAEALRETNNAISEDSYFHGQSPPVYPSRKYYLYV